jgi:hypothetical protein
LSAALIVAEHALEPHAAIDVSMSRLERFERAGWFKLRHKITAAAASGMWA